MNDMATTGREIILRNEVLSVEFLPDKPLPGTYLHMPSRMRFGGASPEGVLAINGTAVPWQDWEIDVDRSGVPGRVGYDLRSVRHGFAVRFDYQVQGYVLALQLTVISDPCNYLRSVEWHNLPLLTCDAPDISIWREEWKQKDWDELIGRGLWTPQVVEKPMAQFQADVEPRPVVYCCLYQPDKVCATVLTNGRYLPLRNQITREGGRMLYALSLGTYQYRVRKRFMPPLRTQVAFLPDINGDGLIDSSDYQLWVNRQLPQPWPTHRSAIWYKIYCDDPTSAHPVTTLAKAEEIIGKLHRYTDGLPQIAYLVGWQYEGHDSGYPSIDKVNTRLGSRDDLWRLHKKAKEQLNTILSYHINLDDSYPCHPGWDETVIGRQPDGALMRWEKFNDIMSYHIIHTKDVESGKVFQRLEAMMREVPLEGSIHIDAFRNMNWSWEPDGFIGAIEELECGVKPIVEFLKSRGIDVTTESMDSIAADWCGIVSGILHVGRPLDLVQLRHGKLLFGGRGDASVWDWGLGSSINWDVIYTEGGKDFCSSGAWIRLLDGIYLGTLLYHFYLEREITVAHVGKETAQLRFSDGTTTFVKRDNSCLLVTHGDVVIADNYDRFIPRGASIYAYSRDGSSRAWKLPAKFKGKTLEVRTLGDTDVPAVTVRVGDHVDLELKPRIPVKLSLKR